MEMQLLQVLSCNIDSHIDFDFELYKITFARLKQVLAFILSIVVLSQSFIACADTGTHENSSQVLYELSNAADNHGSQEDECPPFCQCNCCAGFTVNHTIATYSNPFLTHVVVQCKHGAEPLITLALPIWQPPKLV